MVLYRTCTEPLAPAESSSSSLYSEEDEPTLDAEFGGGGGDAKYSPTYGTVRRGVSFFTIHVFFPDRRFNAVKNSDATRGGRVRIRF